MPNHSDRPDLLERRREVLSPSYRLFYDEPLMVTRGSGVHVYDADGVEYLDAYNNVPCIGHSRPEVAEAVNRELGRINTHTRYLDPGVVEYAERLLARVPIAPAKAIFTCTASEANDLALRVARHVTGRRGVIVTANAYHGTTDLTTAISPSLGASPETSDFLRVVDVKRDGRPRPAAEVTASVEAAIADLEASGTGVAALVFDTMFASDGIVVSPGIMDEAAARVRDAGGLVIADEVQGGFGRSGRDFWALGMHGVEPDMIVMGKSMANGLALAALVGREEHVAAYGSTGRYFNTFAATPVPIAAASVVLDVIDADGLQESSERVGAYLHRELEALAARTGLLSDVRSNGLFVAVDVSNPDGRDDGSGAGWLVNALRRRRVLAGVAGPDSSVLKVRPPLPFDESDADRLLAAVVDTIDAY